MLQLCLTLLFLGTLIQAEPYQPGTPGIFLNANCRQYIIMFNYVNYTFKLGAPWSAEELAIVKSKLYSLFKLQYAGFTSWPASAPKALRLAFHDCLRYNVKQIYILKNLK